MNRARQSMCCQVLMVVLSLSAVVIAQVQYGEFTGTVVDPAGAAVPNATVTVTNLDTAYTKSVTTGGSGAYTLSSLPLGRYKIEVSGQGFKNSEVPSQQLTVGSIQRIDFKLQIGVKTDIVEVNAEAAPLVQTEDSRLQDTVTSTQILNLPLNGRNVYDLIQLSPGAINVKGVLSENGAGTVVNGVREDFNGFLLNGVSNKGLSGGAVNQPIEDTVQEFQLLTLNMSAQYGNSAGSVTNLVSKAGTNNFHGSAFEFLRNDVFDANNFFNNHQALKKPPLRFNQYGGTFGGPIIKNKAFFFVAYQGDRFVTSTLPSPTQAEGPEWRQAVIAAQPNSVAALLYKNFVPGVQGTAAQDLNTYFGLGASGSGNATFADYLCDGNSSLAGAQKMATILGVTAADQTALAANGCTVLPVQAGTFNRSSPFLYNTVNIFKTRTQGNLFHGNEYSARLDYNFSDKDRIFGQFNYVRTTDEFVAGPTGLRGFASPSHATTPNSQFSYVHTFGPSLVNEFRAGHVGNLTGDNPTAPGVPSVGFDDNSAGFGSYNGYPQFFKENIYSYSDLVSISKGKHSMKAGADVRRNIENSEFNVARPSYYFFDPLYFAIDTPYGEAAGVNPDLANGGTGANARLESNVRHWRNLEFGAYFQDDWKVTRTFTLNLGLRYDLYTRHNELNNLATTFIPGPGSNVIDNITTGAGQIRDANAPLGSAACPASTGNRAILAGVCGPGGFAPAASLGAGNHKDFGPRVGFAWDVFGNGKTSLRGGFGMSYEGTLYNPLSNSRWNPPYYSFNRAFNALGGGSATIIYGPQSGGTPSYTGPPDPLNHQGTIGAQAVGNLQGWSPANRDQALLTGIIFPKGIRDPYVYNYYLGIQRELVPKLVLEVDYVGTMGRKLFRAENVNRIPGSALPRGTCITDQFGRQLCSQRSATNPSGRFLNPNYGRLRVWENVVNSNYNALQISLKKQTSAGLTFTANYTFSHAIDGGSTWHSGATSANGRAAGEGFTTDQTMPGLDRGNSIFDVRHRLVANYVYALPFFKNPGPLNWFLGGWQLNGIVAFQTGAHWSPFCAATAACDMNKNGERNQRPQTDLAVQNFSPSKAQLADGWASTDPSWCFNAATTGGSKNCHFFESIPGNPGNLHRNQFVGPNFWSWDPSLFKKIRITEQVNVEFRWEVFNVLNRTNFQLPSGHNDVRSSTFGQAGGTFNPRQMQFGLKISF